MDDKRALEENTESAENNEETVTSIDICLSTNTSFYFSIYDSFGEGTCSYEGHGAYSLVVRNTAIMRGGEFKNSD